MTSVYGGHALIHGSTLMSEVVGGTEAGIFFDFFFWGGGGLQGDDGDPMCGSGVRPADDRALQRGVGHQRQGARAGLTERAEREGG